MAPQQPIAVDPEDLAVEAPERWRAERRRNVVVGLAQTIASLQLDVAGLEEEIETLKGALAKSQITIAGLRTELDPPDEPADADA
jgi:hypothetical protein